MSTRIAVILGLLVWFAASGCGKKPQLAELTGKVTYKGKPLVVSGCQIAFYSDDGRVQLGSTIKDDGTFRVRMAEGYGLPPGAYKVAILFPLGYDPKTPAKMSKEDAQKLLDSQIPAKYHSEKTSGLVVEVPAGGTEFNINLVDEAKK